MTKQAASTVLEAFAAWVATVPATWPAEARHQAKRAFIDIIACMVPGSDEDVSRKLWPVVRDQGEGPCDIVGQDQCTGPVMAALMNGTTAHAMDFDDDFDPAKCHPTAVLAPALMALANLRGKSGADMIDAYIVGLQMIGKIGQGVNPYHRSRGWHATGTVAAVGSLAAAC